MLKQSREAIAGQEDFASPVSLALRDETAFARVVSWLFISGELGIPSYIDPDYGNYPLIAACDPGYFPDRMEAVV